MLGFMLSRSYFSSGLVTAALIGGSLLALRRGQRQRPDLFPLYRPLHRLLEPTSPRQLAVVFNPSKERTEAVGQIIMEAVVAANWPRPRFYETSPENAGFAAAQQAVAEGADLVLAVGGDGTVRAVADALVASGVPLGVVPLGTGNLLARNLGMSVADIHSCVNIALHGQPQAVDMIELDFLPPSPRFSGRVRPPQGPVRFLVMGGAGFDAQIMTDTREDLKARIGWLAYVEASFRHLLSRRRPALISVDGAPFVRRKVRAVLLANTGKIQGGVQLASVAQLSDGQLETVVLSPRNLTSWARLVLEFALGSHSPRFPVVEHFVGSEVEVRFPAAPLPVEVDGDVLGEVGGLRARVLPGAVLVQSYPDSLRVRTLGDAFEAREALLEQNHRWWQKVLNL